MKRIMTLCLLIAMAVGGVQAQKGMQSIGGDLGVCADTKITFYKLIGGGIKYRYHITDNICIEPDIQFYFEPTSDTDFYYHWSKYDDYHWSKYDGSKSDTWFQYSQLIGSANLLYFFGHPKIWRPYVGAGLAFGNRHVDSNGGDSWNTGSFTEGGFQFICGIDKRLSYNFSLQIEAKLFYGGLVEGGMDSEDTPFMANIGLTYNF